ncbi:recombinase family protein [Hyphomicrobium sp. D-2]|uniref:recombinase family protein n=1 Tax=Hyphomicrobium sp. D-2 TaxID=3041621 RepID=UPI002453A99C|nr:recombinase family protein [Hyphomicrobium sp. D-2]MDH4980944.1 recombinase family protein [Hyphomicrobium sp. D-2]
MTNFFLPSIEVTGRRIGYARVSTQDQKLRMQFDALKSAQCDQIFRDHGVSGGKASRPGLDKALKTLKRGDALVVLKLDRLGRSVQHLSDLLVRFGNEGIHFCSLAEGINTTTPGGKLVYHLFAAFAEFQRDIIRENTVLGLAAARKKGSRLGRPRLLSIDDVLEGHRHVTQLGTPIHVVAERLNVSEITVTRGFKRVGLEQVH